MNYVIIGNSAAGIGAIEGIRSVDKKSNITILSNEKEHTYSRPLISYLLQGKTDRQKMKYRPDNFYKDNNCNLVTSVNITKIDKDKKVVISDKDKSYSYDKLLVATGSRPVLPPFKGLDSVAKKFSFMSLADAENLEKAIDNKSNVLIIGAGLIGLKCAEAVRDRVKSVTVVDIANKVLPSILDEESSDMVKKHIENNGINFILSDGLNELNKNTAILSSGKSIEFDVLVIAIGVRPNIELIKNVDGNVNRGVITDFACKTSLDDIYAAGDCVESLDITSGQNKILALLPNAYFQGYCAGQNMAGQKTEFNKAVAMNAIGFFGLHIMTAGSYIGDNFTTKSEYNYKKLFYKDNKLKGFIIVGDINRVGIYTSLIREQTPLDSIDFDLIKEKPQLMAFELNERQEMLGEKRI